MKDHHHVFVISQLTYILTVRTQWSRKNAQSSVRRHFATVCSSIT